MRRSLLALSFVCAITACDAGAVVGGSDAALDAHDAADRVIGLDTSPDTSAVDASPDTIVAIDAVDTAAASDTPPVDVAPVDSGVDAGPHVCPTSSPLDCSPGSGTGMADQCGDGPSCYLAAVQRAVRDVISAHPEWFDYNNPAMCPNILQVDSYMDAVVANLSAAGLCAIRDPNAPGEEVTVKHDNDFSENFDIVASTGCARYGGLIYTGYCAPAWW